MCNVHCRDPRTQTSTPAREFYRSWTINKFENTDRAWSTDQSGCGTLCIWRCYPLVILYGSYCMTKKHTLYLYLVCKYSKLNVISFNKYFNIDWRIKNRFCRIYLNKINWTVTVLFDLRKHVLCRIFENFIMYKLYSTIVSRLFKNYNVA